MKIFQKILNGSNWLIKLIDMHYLSKIAILNVFFLVIFMPSSHALDKLKNRNGGSIEGGTYDSKNTSTKTNAKSRNTGENHIWGDKNLKITKLYPVQVLLTASRVNAITTRNFFAEKGFNKSYWRIYKGPDGKNYYRVFVGNFPSQDQAILVKRKIRKKYKKYKTAFVRWDMNE